MALYRTYSDYLKEKYNVKIVKICPECFAGLPIPRVPSEIREDKVFSKDGRDITEEFLDGAEKTYEVVERKQADFAILKERSPSCGSSYIYDGSFSGKVIQGQGFTARKLNEENIVIGEGIFQLAGIITKNDTWCGEYDFRKEVKNLDINKFNFFKKFFIS